MADVIEENNIVLKKTLPGKKDQSYEVFHTMV